MNEEELLQIIEQAANERVTSLDLSGKTYCRQQLLSYSAYQSYTLATIN